MQVHYGKRPQAYHEDSKQDHQLQEIFCSKETHPYHLSRRISVCTTTCFDDRAQPWWDELQCL